MAWLAACSKAAWPAAKRQGLQAGRPAVRAWVTRPQSRPSKAGSGARPLPSKGGLSKPVPVT